MRYVAGIDVGTSGVKCIIVAEDGRVTASQTRSYPLSNPKEGWSEQNPADWWEGTCDAMKAAVEQGGVAAADIVGVSLSGQMHGLVALDSSDNVIRPAITLERPAYRRGMRGDYYGGGRPRRAAFIYQQHDADRLYGR